MRIVQVGLGAFGRSWASLAQGVAGVELAGIVEPAPDGREWARSTLGLSEGRCYPSLAGALAAGGWDAALVVTPPETHHAVATTLLRGGKDVLVEKPLATTIEDARSLVATAAETSRTVMVSQNYRYRRPARTVQRLIADGAIGELRTVAIRFRRDTRQLFPAGGFRFAMRHPLVLDMTIHHADLLRAVTGQDAVRLFAGSRPVADSPYAHHPAAAAILTLGNGAVVTYEGDWATHDAETSWNGEWDIAGTEGRVRWTGGVDDALVGNVTCQRWGEAATVVDQPELAAVDRAGTLAAFRDAVGAGTVPETAAADNLRSLAIVLGVVASIESGEAVTVERS